MRVEDSVYEDVDVELDGTGYFRCTFRRCRLVYRGGPLPELEENKILDSRFVLADGAERTAAFLRAVFTMGGPGLMAETMGMEFRPVAQPKPAEPGTRH